MREENRRNSRGRGTCFLLFVIGIAVSLAMAAAVTAFVFVRIREASQEAEAVNGGDYEIIVPGEDAEEEADSGEGKESADTDGLSGGPALPEDARRAFEALKAGDARSSASDEKGGPVAQDASVRDQYAIDLVVHAPTEEETDEGCSMQQLRQVMTFRNDSGDTWDRICLRDYAQMHLAASRGSRKGYGWDSRYADMKDMRTGSALSPYRDDADDSVVWVDLDQPLAPGETMQLSFDYVFPILSDVEAGGRATFGYSDNSGWFEQDGSKPVLALGNFYPILAAYLEDGWNTVPDIAEGGECFCSDTADYRLTVAAPADWIVAATGMEQKAEEGLTETYAVWQSSEDQVRDIAVVAGEGLAQKVKTLDKEGVTVVATYYARHEEMGDLFLDSGVASVEAFTQAYGHFPYKSIDVTECALFAGGMEYPELVLISDQLFWYYEGYEDGYVKPLSSQLAVVTAHEVGHNWFYGAVGNDEYREAWLDESFASFSEHVYRKYVYDQGLGDEYDWSMGEEETWNQSEGHDPFIDLPANEMRSYQTTVYPYGCYFLLRLRRSMGDEQFTQMMHTYYDTYKLKTATTEGFLTVLKPYILQNPEAGRLCQVFLSSYRGK